MGGSTTLCGTTGRSLELVTMTPYLLWDSDNRAEIYSLQELEQIVDRLTIQAEEEMPFSLQFCGNAERCLMFTIGGEESRMEFCSTTGKRLIVGCRGPWDDDELIEFTHAGQYTEIERRYCVPIADAREALRRYYQ